MDTKLSQINLQRLQAHVAELEAENQRIRQSEQRYRQVFENAPISMMLFNRDGYLTEMNAAAEKLYDLPIDLFNQQLSPVFDNPQLVENGTLPYMQRALAGEAVVEPPSYDSSRNFVAGTFINGRRHYVPIRDGTGMVVEFVEICPDYADFFALQAQLLEEQERAAQERAQLLSTVARVANLLLRSPDYTAVLPDVLQVLGETARSDRCTLVQNVPDPQTGKAALQLHTQWCRAELPTSIESISDLASALLWEYFPDFETRLAQGETMSVLVSDLAEPARTLVQTLGNVSMLMVPIVVQGEFWGVFGVDYCQEVRLLDEADQAVFGIAADSIAAALERDLNQRERNQMAQQRAIELDHVNDVLKTSLNRLANEPDLDTFLGYVVDTINQQVGAACSHVFLQDTELNALVLKLSARFSQITIGPADYDPPLFRAPIPADATPGWPLLYKHREIHLLSTDSNNSVYWPGTAEWHRQLGHQEAAGLALMAGKRPIGLLGLAFTEKPNLTPEDQELILALADQAALAIQLAELAEANKQVAVLEERDHASQQRAAELEEYNRMLQGRDRILEATATAANSLLSTENLDDAVSTALQIIGESLDTDRVSILEIEPFDATSNLSLVGWWIMYEWHSPHTVSQHPHSDQSRGNHEGIESWLEHFAKGQSLSCLTEELPEPFRSVQAAVGSKAYHTVPIFVEGQYWGNLGIDDCREAKRRDPVELAVLKTAAACIGSAIQRDRTQEATLQAEQSRTRELAHLNVELQHTLDRLAESEEHYRTLFEISSEGIYRFEFDQPIPLALSVDEQVELYHQHFYVSEGNQTYAAMYGFETAESVDGLRLRDVHFSDSDQNRNFIRAILESGHQIQNYESEEHDHHGNPRYFLNNAVTIIENGYAIGGWGTQTDITELRQAQDALLEAQQARVAELAKANDVLKRSLDRLSSEPSLDCFLGHVLTAIAQQFDSPLAEYWYHSEANVAFISMMSWQGEIYSRQEISERHPTHPGIGGFRVSPEMIHGEDLYHRKRYFVTEDFTESPFTKHIKWPLENGLYKQINVPMVLGNRTIGALIVYLPSNYSIKAQQIELAQAVTHQATLAVQLTQLAEDAKQSAIYEERNRMAGEIHDTLAQAFTGISLQLEAAKPLVGQDPQAVQQILSHLSHLAETGLTEARRSVWALYPPAAEYADLAQMLYESVEQMSRNTHAQIEVSVQGNPCPLPPLIGMNLLRVGQEALTNALKHSQAQIICIELTYKGDRVLLNIHDDGCGFAIPTTLDEINGGFGLMGMYERCDRINAQISLNSQLGQGTQIFVEVLLDEQRDANQ